MTGLLSPLLSLACSLGKKTRDGPDISTTTLQIGEKAQKSPPDADDLRKHARETSVDCINKEQELFLQQSGEDEECPFPLVITSEHDKDRQGSHQQHAFTILHFQRCCPECQTPHAIADERRSHPTKLLSRNTHSNDALQSRLSSKIYSNDALQSRLSSKVYSNDVLQSDCLQDTLQRCISRKRTTRTAERLKTRESSLCSREDLLLPIQASPVSADRRRAGSPCTLVD